MNKYPVILAGAGIGGRDNMTLALYKALARADVIVYDRLMDPSILDFAPHAEKSTSEKPQRSIPWPRKTFRCFSKIITAPASG